MKKCEVLKDCVIAICKGSVVYVNDKQYELARKVLKPYTEKVEETEAPAKKKSTKK